MKLTHLIPASGKAVRLSGIPKFLLPIPNESNLLTHHIKLSVENLNADNVKVATNNLFSEILLNLNFEKHLKKLLNIEIFETNTMNETLLNMRDVDSQIHMVTMPDTYISDKNLITKMKELLLTSPDIDCVLGLWRIMDKQREKVGQCLTNNGLIVDVVDKNKDVKYDFLWGTVLFKNTLWEFINKDDPHIGYSFKPAIDNGLKLSFVLAEGRYYDCGTVDEYWEMVREVNYEQ